jgi:hypothetical protein
LAEAVEENWGVMVRFCADMKEKILRLFELKFHPEDSKTEALLNIDRIDTREAYALEQLKTIAESGIYL